MTAAEVIEALRRRHPELEGEWLTYTEPWNIDFFAIHCWGSGIGYRRVSYEVKVSRSDFRAELRNPAKRANALALSHQFFFATPRGLVSKEEIPEECGLVNVSDNGRARIVKQAPLRQPRPLKLHEAIYLMRMPAYRNGTLELRRQVRSAEQLALHYERRQREVREELDRAHLHLRRYAADHVTVGSLWKGLWQPRNWLPAVENATVYVEKVERRQWVSLRRVDTGEIDSFVSVDKLLGNYLPLTDAAVAATGAEPVLLRTS